MLKLGALLHAPHANEAARAVRDGLAKQRRVRKHPPRILFAAWNQPLYVGGRATFIDDLLLEKGDEAPALSSARSRRMKALQEANMRTNACAQRRSWRLGLPGAPADPARDVQLVLPPAGPRHRLAGV